jgi:hypothetical protein
LLGFFCAAVPVFLEVDKDTADAGQGVDEANVFVGIGFELAPRMRGFQVVEEFTHLCGGHLEGCFGQLGGVVAVEEVDKGFLAGEELVAAALFAEPGLEGEFPILGEVIPGEVCSMVAELTDDLAVRNAVENGVIDLVADGFGEPGDFAVAGTGMRRFLIFHWEKIRNRGDAIFFECY